MFVSEAGLTPTQKGNVAEAAITLAAVKLGIGVLKPVQEGLRYDLMFDFHPELARVQCKTVAAARRRPDRKSDVVVADAEGLRTEFIQRRRDRRRRRIRPRSRPLLLPPRRPCCRPQGHPIAPRAGAKCAEGSDKMGLDV